MARLNYCGGKKGKDGKTYNPKRTGKTANVKRVCGGRSSWRNNWCINKKTKNYELMTKKTRNFKQGHDGRFCTIKPDKRIRDSQNTIYRKYVDLSKEGFRYSI